MQIPLIRLQCGCNSYDWGKVGKESAAAKFAAATPADDFTVQEDKPYAELWMGTHPSLPSKDVETKRSLLDMVETNKAFMTTEINEKFGDKLPFLFKVLSISKALSIQAHPNKKLAKQLRERDPAHYPDDNHKPEMVIAITPFDGMCGFRPLQETAFFLQNVPALKKLVGDAEAGEFAKTVDGNETATDDAKIQANKKALQRVFTALMTSSPEQVTECAKELVSSAESSPESFVSNDSQNPSPTNASSLAKLVTRLNSQFPNDIGLFVLFFLNYVELSPGESMFLRADDIHAYLSGDVIECMASSDNVVRAGFTPKFKDVSTLTSMLTFNYAPIEEQKMQPVDYPYVTLNAAAYSSNSSSILYDPPIEEFSVIKTELGKTGAKATFEAIAGPSIFLCTQGEGTIKVASKEEKVLTGYVYFVGATAECILESSGDEPFVTFKAFCELEGKETATKNGHL